MPRLEPPVDGLPRPSCFGQMMRQELRCDVLSSREDICNATMRPLAVGSQQRRICRFLNQRMLEPVGRHGRLAVTARQSGRHEFSETLREYRFSYIGNGTDKLIGELT